MKRYDVSKWFVSRPIDIWSTAKGAWYWRNADASTSNFYGRPVGPFNSESEAYQDALEVRKEEA